MTSKECDEVRVESKKKARREKEYGVKNEKEKGQTLGPSRLI